MGPGFALPLAALACCLLPAGCCVICHAGVQTALKSLKTDFLPNFLSPDEVKRAYDNIVRIVKGYSDLPYSKHTYMGAIGEKTYDVVTKSFLKMLKNVTDTKVKGKQTLEKLEMMLHFEKQGFALQAAKFQKEGHCPNKCGVMYQVLIWCDYCSKQVHICKKSEDCGDRHVEVHEEEELNLNCYLDWHDDAFGLLNYTFYRVWENNSEVKMYTGKEPVLNKPSVNLRDGGNYRCVLGTSYDVPSTIMRFHVTVFPRDMEGWRPTGEFAPAETHEEEETPSPEPILTTTQTVDVQGMVQGRVYGLLICFLVILIAALIFWLLTRKKKKTKPKSSQASFDSKSSRISKKMSSEVPKK